MATLESLAWGLTLETNLVRDRTYFVGTYVEAVEACLPSPVALIIV